MEDCKTCNYCVFSSVAQLSHSLLLSLVVLVVTLSWLKLGQNAVSDKLAIPVCSLGWPAHSWKLLNFLHKFWNTKKMEHLHMPFSRRLWAAGGLCLSHCSL